MVFPAWLATGGLYPFGVPRPSENGFSDGLFMLSSHSENRGITGQRTRALFGRHTYTAAEGRIMKRQAV
ncbi:hypothetical protein [Kingella potus]|uniref:hypothetical protein n=1 Tax=Kingella potus TaxID=265175 RepID=UPI001FD3EA7C|nr:hypothetical protein [Kingella potus]UOP00644.1 hypothetical protein LVJ84_12650 [Kingella potus]